MTDEFFVRRRGGHQQNIRSCSPLNSTSQGLIKLLILCLLLAHMLDVGEKITSALAEHFRPSVFADAKGEQTMSSYKQIPSGERSDSVRIVAPDGLSRRLLSSVCGVRKALLLVIAILVVIVGASLLKAPRLPSVDGDGSGEKIRENALDDSEDIEKGDFVFAKEEKPGNSSEILETVHQNNDTVQVNSDGTDEADTDKVLSEVNGTLPASIVALQTKCPNWSPSFAERYRNECGYWLKEFHSWEAAVDGTKPGVAFWCDGDDCGGWGDQQAGIITSFSKAVAQRKRFSLLHEVDSLEKVFMPCLFKNQATNWALDAKARAGQRYPGKTPLSRDRPFPASSCTHSTLNDLYNCGRWVERKCKDGIDVNRGNRACLPSSTCNTMATFIDANKSSMAMATNTPIDIFSPVQALGCILRANFEPSDSFRSLRLPFWFNGVARNLTVNEITRIMEDHYVISIHVRTSDKQFSNPTEGQPANLFTDPKFLDVFKCSSTVEAFRESSSPGRGNAKKKIMWFLSSDKYPLRQMAKSLFPDRVAFLDVRPTHVGLTHNMRIQEAALASTMAEWFLLGQGDELVQQGDSAFMRTTWVAHLKNQAFRASNCAAEYFKYDLDWQSLGANQACRRGYLETKPLPQDHLALLTESGLTYGRDAWVDYRTGKVTRSLLFT